MGYLGPITILYFTSLLWMIVRSTNYPLLVSPEQIRVKEGENIEAKCIVKDLAKYSSVYDFGWNLKDKKNGTAFEESSRDKNVRVLKIQNAKRQDAGSYSCQLSTDGRNVEKILNISVIGDSPVYIPCHEAFQCRGNQQIKCSYLCDGVANCPFGDDEEGCSKAKEIYPKENEDTEDHTAWLKTTVYTVIACTVGVVLFISIVVIAVCRIKMKRAAVRRAMHQAERRRRHGHGDHHSNSSRAQRNNAVEHEPFISAPSPTQFGNIIVNVNNGVQYVPNIDFHAIIQSPPTYQEVIAETQRESILGRHSPPPIYSTIDRNPNRLSCDVREPVNSQLTEQTSTSESLSNRTNSGEHSSSGVITNTDNHLINSQTNAGNALQAENSFNMPITNSVNNFQTSQSVLASGRDGTRSLERLCRNRQSGSRSRPNVRAVAAPRRPKQLQVRDGRIILDENSSASSSPETVNRNTQTNIADISQSNRSNQTSASSASQNCPLPTPQEVSPTPVNDIHDIPSPTQSKPAQLRVQAGQIMLEGQSEGQSLMTSSVTSDPGGATSSQGHLEVKDGHIVFKTP